MNKAPACPVFFSCFSLTAFLPVRYNPIIATATIAQATNVGGAMPAITRDLNIVARCSAQFRGQLLAPLGLSAGEAPYILYICRCPGTSQEQVATALHVNPSSAARKLARLEEAGFVTRRTGRKDKRLIEVYPTEKAEQALGEIRRINALWHDYLTEGMTEEEKHLLERLLERIRARAVAHPGGEAAP